MPLFSPAGTMPLVTHALVSRSFFLFPFASFLSPLFGSPLMIISLSRYLSSYASAFLSSFLCVCVSFFSFLHFFLSCIILFFLLIVVYHFSSSYFPRFLFPSPLCLVLFPPLCLSSFHGFSFSSLFFISLVLPPFCKNAFVYLMAGGSCTFILFKSSRPYSQYSFPFLSFDLLFILGNAASMHFLLSPCSLSVQRLCLASLLYMRSSFISLSCWLFVFILFLYFSLLPRLSLLRSPSSLRSSLPISEYPGELLQQQTRPEKQIKQARCKYFTAL